MTKEEKIQVMEDIIRLTTNLTKLFKAELGELKSSKYMQKEMIVQPMSIVAKVENAEKICIEEKQIYELMKEIGMPLNVVGYKYIKIAVMLCIEDPDMQRGVTKRLYPTIAKMHNSNISRVERGIRHAVERTFDYGNYEKLMEIFGNSYSQDRGKPTNTEFISGIITYLSYHNS